MKTTLSSAFCLGFALFSLRSSAAVAQDITPGDEKAKARTSEHTRRKAEEDSAGTKRQFDRILSQAEGAADLFKRLDTKATAWSDTTKALLTNEEGRRIAADGTSLMGVLRIYQAAPVPADELSARTKVVDSILSDLHREAERPDVGFLPSDRTQDELLDNFYWARSQLARLSENETTLQTLVAKAPKLSDAAKARTLEDAIRDYNADYFSFINNSIIKGKSEAKEQSEQIVVEKARLAELERARDEADRLYKDTLSKIETMRLDFDLELKRKRAEDEKRLAEAEVRYNDLMAELERTKKLAEANRRVEDAKAEAKSSRLGLEADKTLDKQRCEDPEVKRLLAPFLAHGKYQPGMNKEEMLTADSKAISLSRLRSYGALEPGPTGIQKLLEVATNKPLQRPIDTIRTRWGFKPRLRDNSPESVDEIKKAQQLLNELGPTMVELGMLQP